MKTPRHRCTLCGHISTNVRREIDSGGLSSELVWVCRNGSTCQRRMVGAIFVYGIANPAKRAKRGGAAA